MAFLRILDLPKSFRPGTSHVYPPFKNGRYMEEFVYHYLADHRADIRTEWVYLPVYWTHLQNHPGFSRMRANYQVLLDRAVEHFQQSAGSPQCTFFTVVQHDDGPQLRLPADTVVFGACTGTVPLPLIYEDVDHRLERMPRRTWEEKPILASFVGTETTHSLRQDVVATLKAMNGPETPTECHVRQGGWSPVVGESDASEFVARTLASKFCLAPRGYGRSSFRFFEAMQLGTVPVYVWDDVEWLPYKDQVDYSAFSVSLRREELPQLAARLSQVSKEDYEKMQDSMRRVARYFTLDGMCEYVVDWISHGKGECMYQKTG